MVVLTLDMSRMLYPPPALQSVLEISCSDGVNSATPLQKSSISAEAGNN